MVSLAIASDSKDVSTPNTEDAFRASLRARGRSRIRAPERKRPAASLQHEFDLGLEITPGFSGATS
jgi:hypothetical protein